MPGAQRMTLDKEQIAEEVERRIGTKPFQMWFGSAALSLKDGALHVATGSSFEADWIARRFGRELDEAAEALGASAAVAITTRTPSEAPPEPAPAPALTAKPASSRRRFLDLNDFVVGPSNRLARRHRRRAQRHGAQCSPVHPRPLRRGQDAPAAGPLPRAG